ncbi:hypothetical protein MKW92_047347 [Papaver armeniacum]|nr:hypothetical protein MKW92_047347 [Papaver armeniacum]
MDMENDPILLSDEEDAEPGIVSADPARWQTLRVAQDLLATLFPAAAPPPELERASQLMDEFVSTIEGFPRLQELGQVVEASLRSWFSSSRERLQRSKEVVANLPTIIVTEESLKVINDKMQELPCKHLFHPLCLMPWLIYICVMATGHTQLMPGLEHELPTDNQEYESGKRVRLKKWEEMLQIRMLRLN